MPTMEVVKAASSLMVPRKFRSVRDKSSGHRRNKSSEGGAKARPLTADSWLSLFKSDSAKQALREKEEEEKEATKVDIVAKRLNELNYHEISKEIIRLALRSNFAGGDVDKAVDFLQLQQRAFSGIVQPYDPNVEMLGAENRGNVTCYLDSLLFAMFAHLKAFETMLQNDLENEPQRKLAALIRLWVNMLRSGKLIHTDMMEHIQQALAECGWKDAALLEQQDTSEAFAFIADALQLPLLALQVDLFHQGKGDVDDHKVVHERFLNLAVPPDPDGKGIKLEDCLEEYFNNKVDVLRDSVDEKGPIDTPTLSPRNTIRVVPEDDDATPRAEIENTQLQRRWTTHIGGAVQSPDSGSTPTPTANAPPGLRTRSTSIIQRFVVKGAEHSGDADSKSLLDRAKRTGSSVVKAVTIPAWQFYRLIPWNATSDSAPNSDVELARHFNQRPVVAICLKRYTMTEQGVPTRQNTLIDIPDSLRLPHFMVADDAGVEEPEANGLTQGYKLVLQSVICHRGDSLHSGHYVAYARVAPKLLTDNRRHDHDPPPDYEDPQWVRFDDLAIEKRVEPVDDIQQCLRQEGEMPYVLIYQIVPLMDVTSTSTEGSIAEPPSYVESATNVPGTPSIGVPSDRGGSLSKSASGYFDASDSATALVYPGAHLRPSSEAERPPRLSFDADQLALAINTSVSRRGSVTFSEPPNHHHPSNSNNHQSQHHNHAVSSENVSPAVTPLEETTGSRLSRAAAKFKNAGGANRSRPTSQAGEGRISLTMSRFGFGRPSRDSNSSNGNGNGGGNGGGVTDTEPSPSEEGAGGGVAFVVDGEEGKGKDKEREHHAFPHHHHHHPRKEREKDKEKRDKGKGKAPKEPKEVGKDGVPDRECVVM